MTFHIITWFLTIAALAGVILNIHKRTECFYIWSITNFGWFLVALHKGIYAQATLFLIYFFLALWGIYAWRRNTHV